MVLTDVVTRSLILVFSNYTGFENFEITFCKANFEVTFTANVFLWIFQTLQNSFLLKNLWRAVFANTSVEEVSEISAFSPNTGKYGPECSEILASIWLILEDLWRINLVKHIKVTNYLHLVRENVRRGNINKSSSIK